MLATATYHAELRPVRSAETALRPAKQISLESRSAARHTRVFRRRG